jgi:hypothetical protein
MESTVVAAGMVYVSLRPASVYTWTLAGMVISVAVPMCVLWRRYLRRAGADTAGGSERLTGRDSTGNVRNRAAASNPDLTTNAQVRAQFRTVTSNVEQTSPIISGFGVRVPGGALNGCTDGCTTPRFATVRLCLRAPIPRLSELS